MQIESLTKQQEQELSDYVAKWLAIGRSVAPADRRKTERAITEMYRLIGKPKPYFWWCGGPASGSIIRTILGANLRANLGVNLEANLVNNLWENLGANLGDNLGENLWDNLAANLRDNLGANLRANLGANLRDNLWDNLEANLGANLEANLEANLGANLRDNLWDNLEANLGVNLEANLGANLRANLWDNLRANLGANLGANLRANLGANLRDNLWANLEANLGANLGANLWDNLGANLRANLGDNIDWPFWGQHECYWFCYYDFPNSKLRKMHNDKDQSILQLWGEIAISSGWWIPFEGIAFCCERPSIQSVNSLGQLHSDYGPAILCRDGWEVYALNNVRMNKEHVMTPAEQMMPETVLSEQNADVRRELIRKVGVERMLSKLPHKTLSKAGNYEVLSVDFPELKDARYLKMLNPSIGVWHLEGITREANTVEKALNKRNQNWFTNAEILT